MCVPPQCQHDIEKPVYCFYFGMMTHEESYVLRCLRMELYARHMARLCEHL